MLGFGLEFAAGLVEVDFLGAECEGVSRRGGAVRDESRGRGGGKGESRAGVRGFGGTREGVVMEVLSLRYWDAILSVKCVLTWMKRKGKEGLITVARLYPLAT